jgi:hypothetical protein
MYDPSDPEEEIPSWLKDLEDESEGDISPPISSDNDIPEWLSGEEFKDNQVSGTSDSQDEEVPEWLSSIREQEELESLESDQAAVIGAPVSVGEDDEEPPDWLQDIRQREGEGEVAQGESESDVDYIARIREMKAKEETLLGKEAREQDWVSGLEFDELPKEPSKAEDLVAGEWTGWDASTGDDTDDWIASLADKGVKPDTDVGRAGSEEEKFTTTQRELVAGEWSGWSETPDDTDDWLSSFQGKEGEEQQPYSLDDVESATFEEDETEGDELIAREALEEETSDWLAEAGISEVKSAEVIPAQDEERPSWMEGAADTSGLVVQDASEVSQWDLGNEELATDFEVDSDEPELPSDVGELPEWISDFEGTVEAVGLDQEDASAAVPAFLPDADLDDLDIEPAELPEWLTTPAKEGVEEAPPEVSEAVSETDQGELPGWLQAMRPVGIEPSEIAEDGVPVGEEVTIGPLAGLSDVLPAEPEIVQFGKTPEYSVKLQVTESQALHAQLLDKLIESESATVKVKKEVKTLTQRITRWVVAALLLLVTMIPVLSGRPSFGMPERAYVPVQDLAINVNAVPNGANVLLVFDYQPGLAGEMEVAGAGVVDKLLVNGAHLAYTSTEPTGPALARHFFKNTQQRHGDVTAMDMHHDLGYIPGGTAGLQSLVWWPLRTLPELTQISGINLISDFHMVIVLTDDSDAARSWIEQVQPALFGKPMFVVSSAQAEPLIHPYYQNGQVQGLLGGVVGGAYFERYTAQVNRAQLFWSALDLSVSVSVLIIMTGGAYGFVSNLLSRRKGREKG